MPVKWLLATRALILKYCHCQNLIRRRIQTWASQRQGHLIGSSRRRNNIAFVIRRNKKARGLQTHSRGHVSCVGPRNFVILSPCTAHLTCGQTVLASTNENDANLRKSPRTGKGRRCSPPRACCPTAKPPACNRSTPILKHAPAPGRETTNALKNKAWSAKKLT